MKTFANTDFNIDRIVFAGFVRPSSHTNDHYNRANHGLAFHTQGNKDYRFGDGTVLTVGKNDIIFLPKHSDYKVDIIEPGDCFCVNYDCFTDLHMKPFVIKPKNSAATLDIFGTLDRLWITKHHGYTLKCKALLYELIYTLGCEILAKYTPKSRSALIAPAETYIHENYTGAPISIEMLADMCKMSSAYFRKIFKSVYGQSPVRYINDLKLRRAGELIETGMYTVLEAAEQSGYTDPAHFSHEFKKHYGIPPSEYGRGE